MIVTQADARRIIKDAYPYMPFRLTKSCSIGVRPTHETALGIPTLCWRKLLSGRDSAVQIGIMLADASIDWDWRPSYSSDGRYVWAGTATA